jgi:threonylcarbamoyladenosine tRNA methylthiotransferase MtaB
MARLLSDAGFVRSSNETPDILIVNSCAVTATAVKKSRALVTRLHRQFPDAEIIVIGCLPALHPEILQQWEGVSAVFDSANKTQAVDYITGKTPVKGARFVSAYSSGDRTRSFLKIQDGCDYHCSYCTVAKARGESRSDTIAHVLTQIENIARLDMKEVILTGVNVGDFGKEHGETLFMLLQSIEKQNIIPRIRLSSIEPNLLTNPIIDLFAESSILMPHFHIPLQSGCNRVLSLMRRRYSRELFKEKVLKIKSLMPHACVAADVIAGFPQESNEDFNETFLFIKSLPISYLHVFSYSRRENTPAADMPPVPYPVKYDRTQLLLQYSKMLHATFYREHIDETRPVLFESENTRGLLQGFTDNYLRVNIPYDEKRVNCISNMKLSREILVFPEEDGQFPGL